MSAPAVAVSPDAKRWAAAWKDVREGSPRVWWAFASEPRFGKDGAVAPGSAERDHPSLAFAGGDVFWVAWEEGLGEQARIRARSSARGADPQDVADAALGAPGYPVVACGAGLVVVAWEATSRSKGERVLVRVLEDAGR